MVDGLTLINLSDTWTVLTMLSVGEAVTACVFDCVHRLHRSLTHSVGSALSRTHAHVGSLCLCQLVGALDVVRTRANRPLDLSLALFTNCEGLGRAAELVATVVVHSWTVITFASSCEIVRALRAVPEVNIWVSCLHLRVSPLR